MYGRRLFTLLAAAVTFVSAVDVASSSSCKNPEIRKEWRSMNKLEQLAWLASVKCLTTLPASKTYKPSNNLPDNPPRTTKGSLYDDFVYYHMDSNLNIHNTGFFFPFHRNMVNEFTKALKEKCGYFGAAPYWDWTQDAHDVEHATLWDDNFLWGLGRWGDPKNDYELGTGALSWGFELQYPVPHRLRRKFQLQPYLLGPPNFWANESLWANTSFVAPEVKKAVNGFAGNFTAFQIFVEYKQGMHTGAHLIIGGDMYGGSPAGSPAKWGGGPKWTPNDPLFFMHHAMIDKIWYDWQQKSSANANSYFGGSVQNYANNGDPPYLSKTSKIPVDGLFTQHTIGDVMSTTGSTLCYKYV